MKSINNSLKNKTYHPNKIFHTYIIMKSIQYIYENINAFHQINNTKYKKKKMSLHIPILAIKFVAIHNH